LQIKKKIAIFTQALWVRLKTYLQTIGRAFILLRFCIFSMVWKCKKPSAAEQRLFYFSEVNDE